MVDKSNFTPDEWKLLLESVMMAGIAVTAADPSGLWGLLKEGFASSSELMKAKMDSGANPLIKAVVSDFDTAQGRSTARDGLKEKLRGLKSAEITAKCIETLGHRLGRRLAFEANRIQNVVCHHASPSFFYAHVADFLARLRCAAANV